jgi:hypothetical protein
MRQRMIKHPDSRKTILYGPTGKSMEEKYGSIVNLYPRTAIFQYGTMPFLSLLVSLIDLVFYGIGEVSAVYSTIISTVFTVGWGITIGIWYECDLSGPNDIGASACKSNIL